MTKLQKQILIALIALVLIGAVFIVVEPEPNVEVECDQAVCANMNTQLGIPAKTTRTITYTCGEGTLSDVKINATAELKPTNANDFKQCVNVGGNRSCDLVMRNTSDGLHTVITQRMECTDFNTGE